MSVLRALGCTVSLAGGSVGIVLTVERYFDRLRNRYFTIPFSRYLARLVRTIAAATSAATLSKILHLSQAFARVLLAIC